MFTDTNALNAVAGGPDRFIAGLSAGKTVVAMSTASPAASKAMAAAVRGLGLEKEACAVLFHVLAKLSGVPA